MEAVLIAFAGVVAGVATLVAVELHHRSRPWQTVGLRFGRDITPESVLAVLDRLAGLPHGRAVSLEIRATSGQIGHYLSADPAVIDSLRQVLRAVIPSLRLEPVDSLSPHDQRFGQAIRLKGRLRTIRSDMPTDTAVALLAAMQPLGHGESVVLRWLIGPGRARQIPDAHGPAIEPEDRRRLRAKNEGNVLRVRGWIAVEAANSNRAAHLMSRVMSVLRSRSTAYGQIKSYWRPAWLVRLGMGSHGLVLSDRYAAVELSGLLALPIGAPLLPGVQLGTSPLLIPSGRLPNGGRILGKATWPGAERPVAQPVLGALSHSLIAGPTGVGKSTLLINLACADIAARRPVVVIDGKGDTVAALLERIPAERHRDVVLLDCAADGPQPGVRLFAGSDHALAADVVLGVLSDLFRDSWGTLSERWGRAALVAVAHDPGGTLADVPFVFSDAAYRRRVVGRVRDPLTRAAFAAFEAMKPAERQHQVQAPVNKLAQLVGRPVVRTILGQSNPKLDFKDVLTNGRIVLVSLSPSRVGAPAARLVGALVVFALFQAVQARSAIAPDRRRPAMVYVDEPRVLGDLPTPLDALLEQARGLGVGLALAPQSISQLSRAVRQAALTNASTRIVFRQHADDAQLLAKDLPAVSAEDLGDLAAFEAVARIALGPGDVAEPVTIRTLPAPKPFSDPSLVRRTAAERWGQRLAEVDAALEARHGRHVAPSAPIGRRPRRPQ